MTKTGNRPPLVVPKDMPVIVLVDGGSASASEILSGALQANKRALIIGQPTVGKGVGQHVINIPGDRNMHVTSFEFRPAAMAMDWIGIVPDIEVTLPEDANLQEDPSSDAQLNRAKAEAIAAIAGKPSPARPAAEINARKAELKKKNEENFAKEVEARRKAITEAPADKPAADSTTVAPKAGDKSDK
jgi:C-terminal processing protease CtpA/Prc